jgi:hypothetical protein
MSVRAIGRIERGGRIEYVGYGAMERSWASAGLLLLKRLRSLAASIFCSAALLKVQYYTDQAFRVAEILS